MHNLFQSLSEVQIPQSKHLPDPGLFCIISCDQPVPLQVTSLVTPFLASLAGERPGRLVWLGCGVAMTGTVLLTLDHAPQAASSGLQQVALGKPFLNTPYLLAIHVIGLTAQAGGAVLWP